MKIKNLIVLLIVAVVLVGFIFLKQHQRQSKFVPKEVGKKVFPSLNVNDVAFIQITKGSSNIVAQKTQDVWRISTRYGYPANFTKIKELLVELADLKIGQMLKLTHAQQEKLALLSPDKTVTEKTPTNELAKYGVKVELKNKENKSLASFVIGKAFTRKSERADMFDFGGYPDGQYIRTENGECYLVSKTLNRWDDSHGAWLEDDFLNVSSTNVLAVIVQGKDRKEIHLARTNTSESFKLIDLKEEEGTLDNSKANSVAGALNWLSFDDVADPALAPEISGLNEPTTFTAKTQQGIIYKLAIGNTISSNNLDRYVKVDVSFDKSLQALPQMIDTNISSSVTNAPALPDFEKEAKTLNEKLSPWIFIVKSYRLDNMLTKREDLIKKPEPPKTNDVGTVSNVLEKVSTTDTNQSEVKSENNATTNEAK